MDNLLKIVAIYTRVSTTDQAREGHSLEEQELRLTRYCEAQNYKIYKIYTDAGISGKAADNRPAYQQMLKDLKKRKFNLILSFKMDRISRSVIDLEDFFNITKKYDCGIEFLFEKIDTSGAAGMMFARMLGIFAQFERELIQERTLVGVESAVNKGHFGGKPAFGYEKEFVNGEKRKKWVINEEEAVIVREIFNLCLKGKTYTQIAKAITEKFPGLTYTRKNPKTKEIETKQKKWTDGNICKILNNKVYLGIWEHHKNNKDKDTVEIEGKIPPIVTEEVFYECQDNIDKNSRNYYRSKKYLFMQKLVCPNCGRILACNGTRKKSGKTYLYYKCKDCKIYFREDNLEEALVKKLAELLELYLVLEQNYVAIDSELAKKLNCGKINHTIRYSLDSIMINKKMNSVNHNLLTYIWDKASYEVKCDFINEYIDSIQLKSKKIKNKSVIEIVDLKLKKFKVREFFEMKEKNTLDKKRIDSSVNYSEFKNIQEAYRYADILKQKYNIKVTEVSTTGSYFCNENMIRIIGIKNKNIIEKDKWVFIELVT